MVWPPLERVREVTNRPWKFGPPSGGHGDSAPAGGLSSRDAPPIFFSNLRKRKRAVHGPKEKAAWTRSGAVALRAYGGRRTSACSDLALPSGTLCSSAIPVAAVPWRMAPTSSGWLSHGAASLFATAHAPAKNPAARSAAERAEREADQMRPCTPLTFAPAPRESAFKPVPHPAAPVGRSSQTRRHHLSSTPVQQLCTDVQSCDQKRFFSYTGRGAFSFWR